MPSKSLSDEFELLGSSYAKRNLKSNKPAFLENSLIKEDILGSLEDINLNPSSEKRKLKALIANDEPCQLYMIDVILKLHNFEVT